MAGPRREDMTVRLVAEGGDQTVRVVGDQVVDIAGGSPGDVVVVGSGGELVVGPAVGDAVDAHEVDPAAHNGTYAQGLGPSAYPAKARYTLLSTFQPSHGWTCTRTLTADTADYDLGTQSVSFPVPAGLNTELQKTGLTPFNSTGKVMAIRMKVANPDLLSTGSGVEGLWLFLGTGNFAAFKITGAMIRASAASGQILRPDEWTWVHVLPADFVISTTGAPDMAAITDVKMRFFASASGDPGIKVNAIGYYSAQTAFPTGVVTFCFDDDYLSQYTRGRAVLDQFGFGANAFVIADLVGTTGSMTMAQLHGLEGNHRWEVSGHAYEVANHNVGLATLSGAQAEDDLLNMKQWLTRNGFRGADWFAYPLGNEDATLAAIVTKYFSFARHVDGPRLNLPVPVPNKVRAFTVTASTAEATVTAAIDQAATHGQWLILILHDILASGSVGNVQYDLANLTSIVNYCNTKPIPVRTVGEVLRAVTT